MPFTTSLRVSVRIGTIIEHEDCVRRLAARAREDQATRNWVAYQITAGENGRYFYASQAESWAELAVRESTPDMVRRLFGEKDGNALLQQMNHGVDALQTLVFQPRDDLSCAAPQALDQPAPLVLRTCVRVCPGGQEACEELIHQVTEAVSKVDDERRFTTLQPLIGDTMEYSIVQLLHDPAELDRERRVPQLLNEAFGSEGALILRSGRMAIERIQVDLAVHRPDLSNAPAVA
jgi:hypothetical protein